MENEKNKKNWGCIRGIGSRINTKICIKIRCRY